MVFNSFKNKMARSAHGKAGIPNALLVRPRCKRRRARVLWLQQNTLQQAHKHRCANACARLGETVSDSLEITYIESVYRNTSTGFSSAKINTVQGVSTDTIGGIYQGNKVQRVINVKNLND